MLRTHAGRFRLEWDWYLPGVLWAYRNTPHESTGEKPSFLMFGVDLKTPSQAALFPPRPLTPTTVVSYREEVMLSLSSARALASKRFKQSQEKAKKRYDKKAEARDYHQGDWVLVKMPSTETGKNRKLSQPWYGPYRVITFTETDMTRSTALRTVKSKCTGVVSHLTLQACHLVISGTDVSTAVQVVHLDGWRSSVYQVSLAMRRDF